MVLNLPDNEFEQAMRCEAREPKAFFFDQEVPSLEEFEFNENEDESPSPLENECCPGNRKTVWELPDVDMSEARTSDGVLISEVLNRYLSS
jgi:hypothetical protein